MKLKTVRSAVLSSLFASQVLGKIIPAANKRDDDSNSKFVKLPFHKLYGDSLENVGSDKKPEVRLLKRADGYEEMDSITIITTLLCYCYAFHPLLYKLYVVLRVLIFHFSAWNTPF